MNTGGWAAEGFELVVIGTGSAGMAAAIRGSELGARVAIVESEAIGGTCVNVGCIPSKNLIAAAERRHAARAGFPGVGPCEPPVDWPMVQRQKRAVVEDLRQTKYVDVLRSYPQVTVIRGRARLRAGGDVEVDGSTYRAARIVIATGTAPRTPPVPGIGDVDVLNSTTAMELPEPPGSMIVLGGGAVGLELGQAFARFGTRVTVLELLPRILPSEDEQASEELRRQLEGEGIEVHTGVRAGRVERRDGRVVVEAELPPGRREFRADRLLAATGRRAKVEGLGLSDVGVELDERGFIQVDSGMRTSHPDVFAAGDVTGGPGFVYVAAAGGRVAAENALGPGGRTLDLRAVPRVTFTSPQVAAVGSTADEAVASGSGVEVRRLELAHVPRAVVEHRTAGWAKIVAERGSGRILGVHAVGPSAAELMGVATLAVRLGLTVHDLADTMHPYLTWVEGLKLAAQSYTVDVSKLSCCA